MQKIKGKYAEAIVLATNIDEATINQIHDLCDQAWASGSHIVIQPDAHCGAGCVIGTTMTITDKVCPNVVGVDLNCGLTSYNLGKLKKIDFKLLDKCVHKIPSGMSSWDRHQDFEAPELIEKLKCKDILKNIDRLNRSMGTLGSGNHFISMDKSKNTEEYWLTVHSGSRNLGLQVANYYQSKAVEQTHKIIYWNKHQEEISSITTLKNKGALEKIEERLEFIKKTYEELTPPDALCYLSANNPYSKENLFEDYLHDVNVCREWATKNRDSMLSQIIRMYNGGAKEKFEVKDRIETIHNYIDTDRMILRKGSVSAEKGELFLLPINMAEGIFICEGLGNKEYNYSAPHGAGRVGSRRHARENIDMDEYKKAMKDVYSTCVCEDTLDEAPQAYKKEKDILPTLKESVIVKDKLTPIYNFKATKN